ncbi:PREDICTED: mechanosensitive ion channel protein 10-like [Tarenaya hassleriana]|uniref:mechanosensitive ion channel protein 10-like n=1 Tax=Tarenaya hassleriana TaxID=28532 RepID=UPI00053C9B63|nr:PREDICTED: mechanosensitive ion channel protein 10-like [Tarenaya hassleriana]XP_010536157.1 PREDICTED: mechanosensitive ion channel protein 10-like [Tarenaya hassleriana]XP_010536159.1 PREDICTED: mechanosensitive ion channel protein 10-like [Tarenaya hassleriana]XP_010536160.1 PREDICTED: mechanosensitive ion channel protein 10-like [Tarenaya hassleriana]XP_010536161.1 PREDICTED: mechanosensitive ion channel protein 10-like [Tarenaya hassleriana]XP_010536162.1 PREDICTED: mechanosensitive io
MSNPMGGGEVGMAERKNANGGEYVIEVSGQEASKDSKPASPFKEGVSPESTTTARSPRAVAMMNCPSPEISKLTGSPHKPPKVPTPSKEGLTRRKSLARSVYSKPKSRFVEQAYPIDPSQLEENGGTLREHFGAGSFSRRSFNIGSPNNKSARSVGSTVPLTPSKAAEIEEKDIDEEIYKKVKLNKEKRGRVSTLALIEMFVFVSMAGMLVASLTADMLKKKSVWGLEVWKWCVLAMVTFCGMLVTNWFMHFVVFLIEKNFLLRRKVLYFVHGLKKSVQVFIWLSLVLLTWVLLFNTGVKRSRKATKVLNIISWTLVSILIGAFLWLVKTLLLKILASNFNVNNFFDRIQESIFHQYVLQTLSGPPLIEEAERVGREPSTGRLSFTSVKKGTKVKEKKVIDMGKFHKIKQEKVSAWTMRILVEAVRTSGLSTISNTLDETTYADGQEHSDKEITSEMEAVAAAYDVFKNVAKPGHDYIDEDDLMRFMIKEEVDLIFPLFEGAETGKIVRRALTEWVVKVYTSRKALAHSITDTKTAVKQLNKLVSVVLVIVTVVILLLLLEVATTKVLVFFSTQIVALAFMIGSTCKNLFESMVFVFVMHPFDVGDRCVVDGIPLMVEEMNLLTTVFLKLDNEKVFYPNAVLATKPISNYYRSPEMGDTVEFSIAFSTPVEKIARLKEKIAQYLEQNPQHWQPNHTVVVKEIENVNKLKMALYSNHTITFQEYRERNIRRTELVIAIKKMFEDLHIDYSLLPQEVHLSQR